MSGWAAWPARRPWAALLAAAAVAILSALAVSRVHPSASLESMMSKDDPAVAAAVRVLGEFPAAEELLVLATSPDAKADVEKLVRFAQHLEDEIHKSPEASALCGEVNYRASPQYREYIEKVLVPNGLYYLDRESFEAAKGRLTRPRMIDQIRRNEAMISVPGPGAAAMAKVFLKDPLRLHEFVMDRLMGGRPFKTFEGTDAFVSADGRSILIRISGTRPPSDLESAKKITNVITRLASQANRDKLDIDISGAYAIAAASERAIRADMIASVIGSIAFLAALFVAVYRRPVRLFVTGFVPVAVGVLYGFASYSIFSRELTPLTAVIGGILAGMGIDYSIQYISHFQTHRRLGATAAEAARRTIGSIGSALVAAWATSIVGFVAIGWSRVQALRDFALLGSLGLTGAFVGSIFVLPALLSLFGGRAGVTTTPSPRMDVAPALRWVRINRRPCVIACAILLLAALGVVVAKGNWLALETDMSVMHPQPNPALAAQAKIAQRMGGSPGSLMVYLRAKTPAQLLQVAHRVRERLSTDSARRAGVSGTYGLATLLPDPSLIEERRAAVGEDQAERVAADFRAAVAESSFAPDAFEPYVGFLRHLLTRTDPPTMKDLLARPDLAKTVLPRDAIDRSGEATESLMLVFVERSLDDATTRGAVIDAIRKSLSGLDGATLTGLSVVSHDMQAQIQQDLPRVTLLAICIVLLYLFLQLRNVREPVLALLPMVFSLLLTLAVMHLLGKKLNMINLVTIPLLIGIDVDYAIFIVMAARLRRRAPSREVFEAQLAASCHAIILCAGATLLGFGSLIFTSVPAVRSLGLAVGVGVLTALVATIFCLLPLVAPYREEDRLE